MGIFSKIKDKIFGEDSIVGRSIDRDDKADKPVFRPDATNRNTTMRTTTVDVGAVLSDRYERAGQDLNYQTSIVDLMKLLDLDPSYENRKELAIEMGRTDYSGTAEDNIWLHGRVMDELEKHGGRIPASFRA